MDLLAVKKIHFIGIGGIGMSGLARHFLAEGKLVSGSDRAESEITKKLEAEGVMLSYEQTATIINDSKKLGEVPISMVVYTEAMAQDHPEMVAARELGVPMMNYFEALGLVANDYCLVAVAGTHGKTTTTAMLIDIFEDTGLDPSAVVGSLRARTGLNYRRGKGKYFIVEACEYKRDFLSLEPDVLVITNIEAEHLDYYKDLDDVVDAFRALATKVPEGGVVICNRKDPVVAKAVTGIAATVYDYAKDIDTLMPMKLPGIHNRLNAAAAIAAAAQVGINNDTAKATLATFAGTWRRFEYKGVTNKGALVYDDYAHHPSEVRATLQGVKEIYPEKKVVVVFQPHLFSRTQTFMSEFATELAKAGEVLLLPIFPAREVAIDGVTSDALAFTIAVNYPDCEVRVFKNQAEVIELLTATDNDQTVIVTMGASDIYKLAESLVGNEASKT